MLEPVTGFSNTKMLYGVHVTMNVSRIADRVLAAFLSAFFSCGFFFFLAACWRAAAAAAGDLCAPPTPPASCRGIIFAFSGIGIADGLRPDADAAEA